MDVAFHIIGACADNHAHFDLTDLLLYGATLSGSFFYLKYKFKKLWGRWIKKDIISGD